MAFKKRMTEKAFEDYCRQVRLTTSFDANESPTEKARRIERLLSDYKSFFQYYFPQYAKAECAWFHVFIAHALLLHITFKGILEWFRGSAKSTHATLGYPLWLMVHGELRNMLLVGQTETKAIRLLAAIQGQLKSNQRFINDFGEQMSRGSWDEGEFITKDGIAFYAIGLGQSPRGTRNEGDRPDYIVGDDLDSKRLSKNPTLIQEAFEWIEDDLMGCFDIGRERFLLVNNRFSDSSIMSTGITQWMGGSKRGKIPRGIKFDGIDYQVKDDWHHLRVDAIDSQGEPTWKEKYTKAYWEKKQNGMTMRSWLREYMNHPVTEGNIFKADWIKWKKMLKLKDYDQIIAYCDPSFKNTATSDHKAIKVWGKTGTELHLLKAFVRKTSIRTMVQWFYDLHDSVPEDVIIDYFMESNFLQDLILDEFEVEGEIRNFQLPIRGDDRKKPDKFSRIESTSPLYERGFIYYNEDLKNDPDMKKAVEHLLAFGEGSNTPDDSPDADEGAIFKLQKSRRQKNRKTIIGKRNERAW